VCVCVAQADLSCQDKEPKSWSSQAEDKRVQRRVRASVTQFLSLLIHSLLVVLMKIS
jgi:hypothetical protein